MAVDVRPAAVDADVLRSEIQSKYTEVAEEPEKGFHFHTGARLARMLGYSEEDVKFLPPSAVDAFAGTGNPFEFGNMNSGEVVVDIGCGAGFDALQSAQQVGPSGRVIGVDMTPAMLSRARNSARSLGLKNIEFREGLAEDLPVNDGIADVVTSNGVINLTPDKLAVLKEIYRVLKPGGRAQIADITVQIEVPQRAKDDIDLWSG